MHFIKIITTLHKFLLFKTAIFKYLVFISLIFYLVKHAEAENCRPSDCVVSDWNTWTGCSRTCGEDGTQVRTRKVDLEETCGGTCNLPLIDSRPCKTKCCPRNCQFTPWTEWTKHCACQKNCGGRERDTYHRAACYRFRHKIADAECNGYCESKTVDVQCGERCDRHDCTPTEWRSWEPCIAQCEQQGVRSRRRSIDESLGCSGQDWPDLKQEEVCDGPCCPRDCVVNQWGVWSTCDSTCGRGVQTRKRTVKQGICGGQPCPMNTLNREVKACEAFVPVDCAVCLQLVFITCQLHSVACLT